MRVRRAPRFALCAPPNNLRSHASSAASSGVSGLCARTYYMYVAVFALGALLLTRTHTRLDPGKSSYMCAVWCSTKIQCSHSLSLSVMRPTISIWRLIKFSFGNSNGGKWVTAHRYYMAAFQKGRKGKLRNEECSLNFTPFPHSY